ncbi:hypothetical protein PHYBLDRAFT_59253 [Phycomyces blakesleeanus NRRL 1555(-)]|uniref:Uncharacterized protein n=1 Tax=Phycomyces blakesleeanus (strain ATCC 8743b / DSM 1359 / FGSC 10004 / NBRC 33097 / NRRL 1555) TaxID=763407 RepID=A0A167QT18_PHYB8|nr:hypothetical protein PHYBLDRAFT_59253 [Phycomyces blakesleeanus NRRL 1555(-)]OAD80227.1 hypothetical protein PHYBLDRAFT_59253 [Phycomyces blakesleeanus NRRL 1555(-)]|eukprot:XP_018298267.1 hypothetical protein PHYBLDRAFT_59253 [Phycomyces blakesleeanus NRRL 1555(-)]
MSVSECSLGLRVLILQTVHASIKIINLQYIFDTILEISLRSMGHLTHTTPGGLAHRNEGRLATRQKKGVGRNALKPSASYSESWTPPELSQDPKDNPVGLNLVYTK